MLHSRPVLVSTEKAPAQSARAFGPIPQNKIVDHPPFEGWGSLG